MADRGAILGSHRNRVPFDRRSVLGRNYRPPSDRAHAGAARNGEGADRRSVSAGERGLTTLRRGLARQVPLDMRGHQQLQIMGVAV